MGYSTNRPFVKVDVTGEVDKRFGEVTSQLAEKAEQSDLDKLALRTFVKYGVIDLTKFIGLQHNINFSLWRDPLDGKVKHDWELNESGYAIRYVSRDGDSANDGLTSSTPWSNLIDAFNKIEGDTGITKAKIILDGVTDRTVIGMNLNKIITKKYIITANKPIGSNQWIASYSVYSGNTVVGACPYDVKGVARIDETNVKGNPKSFIKTTSLAECTSTPDSFYSDGTNVYVNRADTTNLNTIVMVSSGIWQFKLSANSEIIINNVTLLNGSPSQPCYFEGENSTEGNVVLKNIRLVNFGGGTSLNGISTDGIKDIKLFNCMVFNTIRDGFNYHNTKEINVKSTVFEYGCYAENVGLDTTSDNNNISTAHEGINIVRVGTKGRKSRGPLIADVNGCYSLNIDVSVYDTGLSSSSSQNAAFHFNDTTGIYSPTSSGKAWLLNCSGGNTKEWGINSDSSFKQIDKIYIDNFSGSNLPDDIVLTPFQQ